MPTTASQFAFLNFTSTGTIGSEPSSLGLSLENGFGDCIVASTGASTDLNGDGNLDLGSTNNLSPAGWAVFWQNPCVFATGSGAANGSGDRTNILLGVLAYNYTSASLTDTQTAQVTLIAGPATLAAAFGYELDGVIKSDTFSGSHASDLAIGTPVTITYTPPGAENESVVVGGGMVGSSVSVAAAASVANTAETPAASSLAVPVANAAIRCTPTVSSVAASGNAAAASPASVVVSDPVATIGGASEEAVAADLAPAGSFATTHPHMNTIAADKVFAPFRADVEGINPVARWRTTRRTPTVPKTGLEPALP